MMENNRTDLLIESSRQLDRFLILPSVSEIERIIWKEIEEA